MLLNKQVNMTLGYFPSTPTRELHMTSTTVYHASNLIWIVPPGRMITSLEKLALPFKKSVWIGTVIVLIGSLIGACVIKNRSIRIQNFIFGKGVRDPCLNIISVTLGGPMTKIPFGNFARTMLAIFMIYCFIMQNSYKSALFKFMQMTIREPDITSTDQLVAKDFKFYMYGSSAEWLGGLPEVVNRSVLVNFEDFNRLTFETLNSDFKGALLSTEDHLAWRNIEASPDHYFRHAPEIIFTNNIVVYLAKHSCLTKQFNRVINNLLNGGLFKYWASKFIDKAFLKHKTVTNAVPLTMNQLNGCFEILVFGLLVSILAFSAEKAFKVFTEKLQKLK